MTDDGYCIGIGSFWSSGMRTTPSRLLVIKFVQQFVQHALDDGIAGSASERGSCIGRVVAAISSQVQLHRSPSDC